MAQVVKLGIYSGKFDPVHKGHIEFALEAAQLAGLDKVVFIPEPKPRRVEGVTHFAHRLAMLKLATKPFRKLEVIELPDKTFSVNKTLPRIKKLFPDAELFLLLGSDIVKSLKYLEWPDVDRLMSQVQVIIGMRQGETKKDIEKAMIDHGNTKYLLAAPSSSLANSTEIRSKLAKGQKSSSSLRMIDLYIRDNWLYVSLSNRS